MNTTLRLAALSILVGFLVFGLKYVAYVMTGSVALFSDALETVVNVLASFAALLAIWLAQQPPDDGHPFGHHKVEYLSAAFEGALIALAAAAIFYKAWPALFEPRPLDWRDPGLLVNAAAGVINGLWSWVLITQGRKLRSPALVADGKHLKADVFTSIGVLGGVIVAGLTGWHILDPILALLVAGHILVEGSKLMWESVQGLMDAAPDEETMLKLRDVIRDNADGALEFHELRARQAGSALFAELHLVVPGHMTVERAHAICDRVERAVREEFPGAQLTIHVEPHTEREGPRHGAIVIASCRPAAPVSRRGKARQPNVAITQGARTDAEGA